MTSTPTRPVMHEPSAWLRGAMARKLAQIDALEVKPSTTVLAPLGRTEGREDRTCDRCRHYVPLGPLFYVDLIKPRPGVVLVVGLCQVCRDLERGEVR